MLCHRLVFDDCRRYHLLDLPASLRTSPSLWGTRPCCSLRGWSPGTGAALFAKLEFLNPGGSIKDRAALGMILDAEARGLLHPGSTILEATAGNTGVGLALIGVNRGYKVKLFVPEGFAEEKCILMRGFGAEVMRTPEAEGMAGRYGAPERPRRRFRDRLQPASSAIRRIRNFTTTRQPRRSGSRWTDASMRLLPESERAELFPAWQDF